LNVFNSAIVKLLPLVPKSIVRRFANRYIAGEELMNAVELSKKLNERGMMTTLDVLGEHVTNHEEANKAKHECMGVISAINKHKLDSNLSLKLTQLGLKLDFDFCYANLKEVLETAKKFEEFVRLDMEDSSCTDDTFRIFEKARAFYPKVGIVVQAYLRRTYDDVLRLSEAHKNFRLCKGIYVESEEIAYKDKEEIRDNYLEVLRLMFEKNCYIGIATHDDKLIAGAYKLIEEFGKKKDDYEFQMLLGVRENLRNKILKDGHRLRIYIPFGVNWYQYSLRRFKENPQIAGYVLKSIFSSK
jgi:proline dehydrogenase